MVLCEVLYCTRNEARKKRKTFVDGFLQLDDSSGATALLSEDRSRIAGGPKLDSARLKGLCGSDEMIACGAKAG